MFQFSRLRTVNIDMDIKIHMDSKFTRFLKLIQFEFLVIYKIVLLFPYHVLIMIIIFLFQAEKGRRIANTLCDN